MNNSGRIFYARSTFNVKAVTERLAVRVKRAQMILDAQVVNDSNYYCPVDTGTLKNTAIIHTQLGKSAGRVVWGASEDVASTGALVHNASYARAQYYGTRFDHSKSHNPRATAKWFETAKARYSEQWKELVEREIRRS